MGLAGNELIKGLDRQAVIARLDSLHAYEMTVMHWALALQTQLVGEALVVLKDELAEVASQSLAHARTLADRVASLGGCVTADPTALVALSPAGRFELPPSARDVSIILSYALVQLRAAIRACGELLASVADKDELTHRLLLHVLRDHVAREDDIEAALATSGQGPPAAV